MALCLLFIVSSLSIISAEKRPNFLLLFPDEWRFDWADQYFIQNLEINTPTFSSIVQNGTRFVHTSVGSPLCAPSRSCIAAGKEYDYTGVWTNGYDFPKNETTFYLLLQKNGYWTMVSGKDDLVKPTGCGINGTYRQKELGFSDQRRCKGKGDNLKHYPNCTDPFAVYLDAHYDEISGLNLTEWNITAQCYQHCCVDPDHNHACSIPIPVEEQSYEDNYITDRTLEMLDNIPDNIPWFLQINWAGPHPPFIITESMNETVNNRSYPYPMNATENKEDMSNQTTRADYTAEIENLDRAFETIINKIRDLGQYDDTIFCVSSDHGEMLGDFNLWDKSKPWVASTNVPFVCMGPGIKRNNIINTYVTNMDIAGTVLDYTNTPLLPDMTTISLRAFLNGTWNDDENKYRQYISSGLNGWRMVVADMNSTLTWKFVCCQSSCPGRGFEPKNGLVQLLFNIKQDMYEKNNVASQHPTVVKDMKALLPPNFCVPGNYTGLWEEY